MNEPNFPYSREDPIIVKADLLIEDIHSINGKDLDFESSFSLWAHWKDERVANTLKNMGSYTSEGKPLYLCDFSPTQVIGETRKIFDPVVEVFPDSLTMERTAINDLTLIIHRIYEEHMNMTRNSFDVLDNYS